MGQDTGRGAQVLNRQSHGLEPRDFARRGPAGLVTDDDFTQLGGVMRRLSLLGESLDLTGTKLDGSPFDWAAYRGKIVLVCFWSSRAPEIASELAFVRKNLGLYGSGQRGFDVVGVNLDDNRQQADRFLEREPQPWVNLRRQSWPKRQRPSGKQVGCRRSP